MDGRTDGRMNRQTETKKEKKKKKKGRRTNGRRALSSHCFGRNIFLGLKGTINCQLLGVGEGGEGGGGVCVF
jgi:hypothetical protein